jgi:hypothetical protein
MRHEMFLSISRCDSVGSAECTPASEAIDATECQDDKRLIA